jgi:Tfp pilus assembly protein PilW
MIAAISRRLSRDEAGMTLIELLVAATMGVILMGAVGSIVVSAVRDQPKISEKASNIQTVRWVLERMTRELRNGFAVNDAQPTTVSFETYVRHSTCGSNAVLAATSPSIRCQVRYTCATGTCSRVETAPGVLSGGTPVTIVSGLGSGSGFGYSPGTSAATHVTVTLAIPGPDAGTDATTVSDGASLRNATLAN